MTIGDYVDRIESINRAIDLLDNLKGMIEDSQGNDYDEAFRVAIKALKRESKTVQKEQAESEKYQKAYNDGYDNGYAQAKFDYGY